MVVPCRQDRMTGSNLVGPFHFGTRIIVTVVGLKAKLWIKISTALQQSHRIGAAG